MSAAEETTMPKGAVDRSHERRGCAAIAERALAAPVEDPRSGIPDAGQRVEGAVPRDKARCAVEPRSVE
jgi:hypothetical protein